MAEFAEKRKPLGVTVKEVAKRVLGHENSVLGIVLVVIVVVLAVVSKGVSVTKGNVTNIVIQSATRGIAAIGEFFVLLTAGIDISVGGIALMSSLLCASLTTEGYQNIIGAPIPLGVGILIMLLLGLGVGAFNGFLTSRLGISSVIVTLAMWIMSTGFGYLISRGFTIQYLPVGLAFFGSGHIAGIPTPIIMFIVVAVTAYFVSSYTTFGRSVYAAGGNSSSAWLSGVNVKNMQLSVLIISGFLAALSGLIIMGRTMVAGMVSAGGLEIDAIAAALIGGVSLSGGRGSVIGVVLGALMIGVINNGMNIIAVGPAANYIVKGAIMVVAVAIDIMRRRG